MKGGEWHRESIVEGEESENGKILIHSDPAYGMMRIINYDLYHFIITSTHKIFFTFSDQRAAAALI